MGSQQSDGTPITQKRNSIRNVGKAFTDSADRVESRTVSLASGVLGPQIAVSGVQFSAMRLAEAVKIARSDTDQKVQLVAVSGLVDL